MTALGSFDFTQKYPNYKPPTKPHFEANDFQRVADFLFLAEQITDAWLAARYGRNNRVSFRHVSEVWPDSVDVTYADYDGNTFSLLLPREWFNLSHVVPEGGTYADSERGKALAKAVEEIKAQEAAQKEADRAAHEAKLAEHTKRTEEETIARLRKTRPELFKDA